MSADDKCPHGERMGAGFCRECNQTLMQMIGEMNETAPIHIFKHHRGGHVAWLMVDHTELPTCVEPGWCFSRASLNEAIRALYEKWKAQ